MKNSFKILLLLVVLALVPNGAGAWNDLVKQVENTVVHVKAVGIDSEEITTAHSDEAKSLAAFADTFNKTAYRDNLSGTEKCSSLTLAANEAIKQKSSTFRGLYDVECSSGAGSKFPELKMIIYPQTSWGYSFVISFIPQPE